MVKLIFEAYNSIVTSVADFMAIGLFSRDMADQIFDLVLPHYIDVVSTLSYLFFFRDKREIKYLNLTIQGQSHDYNRP